MFYARMQNVSVAHKTTHTICAANIQNFHELRVAGASSINILRKWYFWPGTMTATVGTCISSISPMSDAIRPMPSGNGCAVCALSATHRTLIVWTFATHAYRCRSDSAQPNALTGFQAKFPPSSNCERCLRSQKRAIGIVWLDA